MSKSKSCTCFIAQGVISNILLTYKKHLIALIHINKQ